MDFIDRDGSLQGISAFALVHPVLIGPLVVEIPNHRSGARRFLVKESEWVCLVDHVMPRNDVILVKGAFGDSGDKIFPDAGILTRTQRMRIFIPIVEAAYDGH